MEVHHNLSMFLDIYIFFRYTHLLYSSRFKFTNKQTGYLHYFFIIVSVFSLILCEAPCISGFYIYCY